MSSVPFEAMGEDKPKMNLPAEIGTLVLRLTVCSMVVHHGLQKLQNPEGFTEGIVAKYFTFLPFQPIIWTYMAASMEIVAPLCLALGIFARLASFGLFMTMCFATTFHLMLTGSEGYPLGVPKAGAYAFEPSVLCGAIFVYFIFAGPGKFSVLPSCL
mmetsp:Transcript_10396/g.21943  ORF Transcript_10396/g.21943 Transcript_10396/m.21943 type:complete len:157 (+) Transcript_10396:101-571(+)